METNAGLTALAGRLAERFAAKAADGCRNLVFSPLSIYSALALVAAGARGRTLDELLSVLGAASRDELVSGMARRALSEQSGFGGPHIALAFGIWSDATRPVKPGFRDIAVGTYKAEATAVDFRNKPEEAREQINAWVEQATRGLIRSLLPPGSVRWSTGAVVGNAVYLKGEWHEPFNKRHTRKNKFYRLNGTSIDVPFMQSYKKQFIASCDGFKVLRLLYKRKEYITPRLLGPFDDDQMDLARYSMYIVLPEAHDGLVSLMNKITSNPSFLHEHLPTKRVPVGEFRMPKFKLSFCDNITGILQELGLRVPFSLEADLSDVLEEDGSGMPLVLEDVVHKAVVEVNVEGTEATAATAPMMFIGSMRMTEAVPEPVDFIADHPFPFFIAEDLSSAVVFAGHVVDPSIV